ncbi:MAG: hypothetical protein R3F11_06705 [Verrucomicrobiales bacterium]
MYGNKGSTDQHAYVQQLRDGVNNFFATFIEVREGRAARCRIGGGRAGDERRFPPGISCGDACRLGGKRRQSITLSIPRVDAFYSWAHRSRSTSGRVGYYAAMLPTSTPTHQPGVEATRRPCRVSRPHESGARRLG